MKFCSGNDLRSSGILRAQHEVEYVLVGDGPSKTKLIEEASARQLPNVRFLDPVPKGDIPHLLAAADVAIISLKAIDAFAYAVSPNKLFDYMAAGKPVLCAVPGEMARLVQENKAGIAVEPENPAALAAAVQELFHMDPAVRAEMGERGRNLVAQEFAREKLAERLLKLCN